MRKEIADLIFPVFRKTIELKEGLADHPRSMDFTAGQKRLLALLQSPVPESLRPDLLGDQRSIDGVGTNRIGFLGMRYALACWLDEIFIADSPWKDQWNDSKVETTLYGINERASEFWKQAQLAQTWPTREALEVYYLCAMLGFRGEMIGKSTEMQAWREKVEPQITQGEGREYALPPGMTITPNVRALKGAPVMQRWFVFATVMGLLLIPLVIVLLLK
jgi:type VI secretion system protein ImpK